MTKRRLILVFFGLFLGARAFAVEVEGDTESCKQVREELKTRYDSLPESLRQLGGEQSALRRYSNSPTDYFKEGMSTACKPTRDRAGMFRDMPRHECPEMISVTFNFPSLMAYDSLSAEPLDTVYFSLMLSTTTPSAHIELPLSAFKFDSSGGFVAKYQDRVLIGKSVDKNHMYLEWKQKSEIRMQREQYILVEFNPKRSGFDSAVPFHRECHRP